MIIFPVPMGSACVIKNITTYATINQKGKINVRAERGDENFHGISLPFFRGIAFFIFGLYLFIKSFSTETISAVFLSFAV